MKLLLITPPMTQVNSPYPATPYLTAYLRAQGYQVEQKDLGLDLFHKLFSLAGLTSVKNVIAQKPKPSESEAFFLEAFADYAATIGPAIHFLKGQDPSLALRIAQRKLLPEGPRFLPLNDHPEMLDVFGGMGVQDQAKYIASLYLDDLGDYVKEGVDSRFEFSRYGESLASSQASLNPLVESLQSRTLVDELLDDCITTYVKEINPDVVGFTMPFPGNVYGALRASLRLKELNPKVICVAGGGFVNTELRELSDKRLFTFFDYLIFDDGERPLQTLLEHLDGKTDKSKLVRTWYLEDGTITKATALADNVAFKNLTGPTYDGLSLSEYVPMLEMPNPMHRMWSDFRWNKLILAHGCYWKKCTFCDISLDYIKRFEPARVETLVQIIERLVQETGRRGFHFVDEAAPPAILKTLSEELLSKKIPITWWGNIRFDKQFTGEVTQLMADAGCVAVTGGLEVASPRILDLIKKGTSVEQVAQVTKNFSNAGVFVHAYLMYGFPTQTTEETIDSLEVVRQLFKNKCINSAFWHRFVATPHSPVGKNPTDYGITLSPIESGPEGIFSRNAIPFIDPTVTDHQGLGVGLRKAVYNYMHGIGIDEDVRSWFDVEVPKTTLKKDYLKKHLKGQDQ